MGQIEEVVVADRIYAGTITAQEIVLATDSDLTLFRSSNYDGDWDSSGLDFNSTEGFAIASSGEIDAWAGRFRGYIKATSGEITGTLSLAGSGELVTVTGLGIGLGIAGIALTSVAQDTIKFYAGPAVGELAAGFIQYGLVGAPTAPAVKLRSTETPAGWHQISITPTYVIIGTNDGVGNPGALRVAKVYDASGNLRWTVGTAGAGNSLDADMLDGYHAASFAGSAHNHDADYISIIGSPEVAHFPYQNAGGELYNSGYAAADFATAGHDHTSLTLTSYAQINLTTASIALRTFEHGDYRSRVAANVGGAVVIRDHDATATAIASFDSALITCAQQVRITGGTAADPALYLYTDSTSGFYRPTLDVIGVSAGGTGQVKFTDGAFLPVTDNDIDLGSATLSFKDYYGFNLYDEAGNLRWDLSGNLTIGGNITNTAAFVVQYTGNSRLNQYAGGVTLQTDETGVGGWQNRIMAAVGGAVTLRDETGAIIVTVGASGSPGVTLAAQLLGQAGTAAAPSHSFSADPDTGGYRSGANKWSVATGGTQRVEVSSAGLDILSGELLIGGVAGFAMPIGAILPYGGSSAPSGYLLCNGSAVSRTTYANLFAIISTTFGAGDGSTTFNLPDLRQRFPLGKAASGTGSTLGGTGGYIDHTHAYGTLNTGLPSSTQTVQSGTGATAGHSAHDHDVNSGATGSNNPPYQVVNYIIKY
jgi:microcystin-dependent protein